MAVIFRSSSSDPPKVMIKYAMDPLKTEQYAYVSCIGCDPETAAETFIRTKDRYEKKAGLQVRHIIQSFKPGEVSPMVAHEIGNRFVKELFDDYEVVIATHTDKPHVHNHIVVNTVSDKTGMKHHYDNSREYLDYLISISNRICREYGLSEYQRQDGRKTKRNEWRIHKGGMKTRWDLLYRDVDETIRMALDLDNFFELMEKRGYQIIRRNSRFPLFRPKGSSYRYGIHKEGRTLTEEDLRKKIEQGIEEDDVLIWEAPKEKNVIPLNTKADKGLPLLYQSWLDIVQTVGRGEEIPYPLVSYKEAERFWQYRTQQEYLQNNDIETMEQLQERIKEIEKEINTIKEEKSGLMKRRRQLIVLFGKEPEKQKEENFETGEADRRMVTLELDRAEEKYRSAISELHLCRKIESNVLSIEEKLNVKTIEKGTEREQILHRT